MYPHLIAIPLWIVCLLGGGLLGASALGGVRRFGSLIGTFAGAVLGGVLAYSQGWGQRAIPVQAYGTMILIGFLVGVWMGARRARKIGVEPRHIMDIGVVGVGVGLLGARLFHIAMHWAEFDPFVSGRFELARVVSMFKLWEGGLVFFGAFVLVIPGTYLFCRLNHLPAIKLMDLTAPSLIAGQAFGRIGCFFNGCCFGRSSDVPWSVRFPADSPPFNWQVENGLIDAGAACSLAVHPAQIYAAISAALTAGFLYAFWPRRRYDGQVLSLMLMMAAATRFFEELLRDDERAFFPALSSWMTVAQWFSLVIFALGVLLMVILRRRRVESAEGMITE